MALFGSIQVEKRKEEVGLRKRAVIGRSFLITYTGGGGWAADLGVVSLQEREVYKPLFYLDGSNGLDIVTDLENVW